MGILDRFRKKSSNLGTAQPEKPPAPIQPKASVLGGSNGVLSSSDSSGDASADSGTIDRSGQDESNTKNVTRPSAVGKPSHTRTNLSTGLNTNLGARVGRDDDVLGLSKRVEGGDPPIRITIMNGKGGSGKSTITTNLATVLTTHPNSVTIIDNDPQASSIRWLRERPHTSVPIKGVTAGEITRLRNIQLWNSGIGPETKYVIIDTQAGLKGIELSDVIDRSDMIIIPVLPSAIDMRATADFVAQVFLSKSYRRARKPIGVVANRVINDSIIYRKLQKFLLSLRMNFISTFSDNKAYLIAAEKGMGVFEVNEPNTGGEKTEWDLLAGWVEDKRQGKLKSVAK